MILTLDLGNTHIFGGVFSDGELILRFRKRTRESGTSDEIGLFLKSILRENKIEGIKSIACCCVVPDHTHSLRNSSLKYFSIDPIILTPDNSKLKILYKNPSEVGADRISNAIAAITSYPNRNIIIVDFGTATTFCAISKKPEYLGGIITPGLNLSMNALVEKTAKLPKVEIINPKILLGTSTVESIQSGLYNGNFEMVRGLVDRMKNLFENPVVIGTGGFSSLFSKEKLFDVVDQSLVLKGLYYFLDNQKM